MLSYGELKPGVVFIYEDQPFTVLSSSFLRKQQRKPVMQTEIKSLTSGKILQRNFQMNESFEEADIEKENIRYLYNNKGEWWFCDLKNPGKRLSVSSEIISDAGKYTKENSEVVALKWNGEVINIEFPIKSELKVTETPPSEKGNTVSGGNKHATLETGAVITVPMFINTGDIIRVNTQTGEYTERVEKA